VRDVTFAEQFGALSREAAETEPILEAEYAEESIVAPAPGQTLRFKHGPLVEANLTLTGSAGTYVLGLDYFEDPSGGFENVRIPEGVRLMAAYFYHAEPTESVTGAPAPASPGSATTRVAGPRFATLLKMGV
jgi:hypothetical protein